MHLAWITVLKDKICIYIQRTHTLIYKHDCVPSLFKKQYWNYCLHRWDVLCRHCTGVRGGLRLYRPLIVCLLQVHIGYADYSCPCVRLGDPTDHMTTDHRLAIALAVGLGVPLIIIIVIIIIVVIFCRRRGDKAREETITHNGTGLVRLDHNDSSYSNTAAAAENDANDTYSHASPSQPEPDAKVYTPLGSPEPDTNKSPQNGYECWLHYSLMDNFFHFNWNYRSTKFS